jgi:MYXO-CTERM domain-containing protein
MPRSNPELGDSQVPVGPRKNQGNCSLGASGTSTSAWSWLAAIAALSVRRRRAR